MTLDEEYMLKALELAEKAYALGEIPVGAIVVSSNYYAKLAKYVD